MSSRLAVFSLLISFSFIAVGQSKPARPEMLVTTDWLASHLHDKNLVVVEVGPKQSDYDAGHIPGARFLATEKIAIERDGMKNELLNTDQLLTNLEAVGISNKSRVIIYPSQSPTAATRLYWTLDYLGIAKNASLLDGGIDKWKAEKRALSTESVAILKPGKMKPRAQPELLAKLNEVKAATAANSGRVILDARSEKRYVEGHIPGAVPVFWQHTVNPASHQEFADWKDLKAVYDKAGLKPGSKVVTYCETGMQASHAYFTAKYLGYAAKIYDGSFQEWNDLQKQPVMRGDKPQ
jgi:thiosulfate/3-mercaptopyruvate sulfurtransferase